MVDSALIAIGLAFAFTFTNGFQDASAVAATFIASRSATPRRGILFIGAVVFLGAILGGSAVAFTLANLLTLPSGQHLVIVLLIALTGATFWNLVTWKYGLPSSSTHAIIGGMLGAGFAAGGFGSVFWGVEELFGPTHQLAGLVKIIVFLFASIPIGLAGGYVLHRVVKFALRNARRSITGTIVQANWIAAGLIAFSNGSNDAQKQMGVIAIILFAAGASTKLDVPFWARIACALLITFGTIGGGWRIMKTLGQRIFKIEPVHSLDSQIASGTALALSTFAGAPVSSTHIIASSVIGVGAAENPRKVQWSVGKDILIAMVMTIPGTAALTALMYMVVAPFAGV